MASSHINPESDTAENNPFHQVHRIQKNTFRSSNEPVIYEPAHCLTQPAIPTYHFQTHTKQNKTLTFNSAHSTLHQLWCDYPSIKKQFKNLTIYKYNYLSKILNP
jgi:hypothetical protein